MTNRILFAWIGKTDLDASLGIATAGVGPIARAVEDVGFAEVVLLTNYPVDESEAYVHWLKGRSSIPVKLYPQNLSSPTNFSEIYEATIPILRQVAEQHRTSVRFVFHLSPGTPAMAAVWIIIGKTRFPAELIQSDKKLGVQTVNFPFDLSAEYIQDLLKEPDARLRELSPNLPPEAPEFEHIIHRSPAMVRVVTRARMVAPRSVPVLIEGETGTGKELLARAIHQASPRKNKPFVPINCGAIPATLIESELFGHEKGAFTGAATAREGKFEAAHQGTLFLDEIGELPPPAQVALLRTLQEQEIVRVGSNTPRTVDVRIVAATNRNLIEEVAAGRFRSDLFYRLGVAILKLPPLRERQGDVKLLIERLLDQVNQESRTEPGYRPKRLAPGAITVLQKHDWPGNIRELLNTLRRAAVWTVGDTITIDDARDALLPRFSNPSAILDRTLGKGFRIDEVTNEVRIHYIKRALLEANQNRTKAAELLGLNSYQTLSNWMRDLGIGQEE